jgi:hypothetical protein
MERSRNKFLEFRQKVYQLYYKIYTLFPNKIEPMLIALTIHSGNSKVFPGQELIDKEMKEINKLMEENNYHGNMLISLLNEASILYIE